MSDSLRDALKDLRAYCGRHVDDPRASEAEQEAYDDVAIQLAQILRAHPAEPVGVSDGLEHAVPHLDERGKCLCYCERCISKTECFCSDCVDAPHRLTCLPDPVGVSDEAVEAAVVAFERVPEKQGAVDDTDGQFRDAIRAALESAAPLMGSAPRPSRKDLIWAMCRADRKEPEGKSADWLQLADETFGRYADAVLALMGGAE